MIPTSKLDLSIRQQKPIITRRVQNLLAGIFASQQEKPSKLRSKQSFTTPGSSFGIDVGEMESIMKAGLLYIELAMWSSRLNQQHFHDLSTFSHLDVNISQLQLGCHLQATILICEQLFSMDFHMAARRKTSRVKVCRSMMM